MKWVFDVNKMQKYYLLQILEWLKQSRFKLNIGKKFFAVRIVRRWNWLPREAMDSPNLEVFKAKLDGT